MSSLTVDLYFRYKFLLFQPLQQEIQEGLSIPPIPMAPSVGLTKMSSEFRLFLCKDIVLAAVHMLKGLSNLFSYCQSIGTLQQA